MTPEQTRKPLYHRVWFWLAALVLVYAVAGFVALPWYLERLLPQKLNEHMGWNATVGNIAVNPFALSVEATELEAMDGSDEAVLAFDRLYVNLGLWRLVTGVLTLQAIETDEPFVRLELLDDYSMNLARDWQANNPAAEPAAESAGSDKGPPLKLYLQRVVLNGGELLFRDFSQGEPVDFRIMPLDLLLEDLATYPRDDADSEYTLTAAIGNQTVHWDGSLNVAPLASSGYLRIANVESDTLQHFLKRFLPYNLNGGSITVGTDYELRLEDELLLGTTNGVIGVRDLALGVDGGGEGESDGESAIRTARVNVDQIRFGLASRKADVGLVTIEGADLQVARDKEGELNLLRPFSTQDQADEAEADAGDSAPFRWSVSGVELTDSRVQWRDQQLDTAAELTLEDISLTLGKLSYLFDEPVPYRFEGNLSEGGRLVMDGRFTPTPFTLEAGLTGSDIALAPFEPYLQAATTLAIRDGHLNVDGNLDLDEQTDPLTGTFSGTGEIHGLDLGLAGGNERLLSWQSLRLAPIEYNVAPARLEVGTVTLAAPEINVVRGGDGLHNLERIVPPATGTGEGGSAGEDGAPGIIFRIGEFVLEEGELAYTDRTLSPVFATRFSELNGAVTGLSNIPPQQGRVAIRGRVGELSKLAFDGSIGTLGTEDSSKVAVTLDEMPLPVLSPYFGRYLGYGVDSGKLNLNLDYQITGSRITASNLVVMDRLELGQAVASDEAVDAPVKLGLALLRDQQGVIEIDLPISGDLNDPDFSVGKVVMRAFVNLLAKAATSPFSMLGSIAELAGLSGEELGQVAFVPGQVTVAEGEDRKLDALADALKERPQLLLNVRGAVAPELDGLALKRQRLFTTLGIGDNASLAQRVSRLEQAYNQSSQQSAAQLRQQAESEGGSLTAERWEQVLVARLANDIPLPPEALENLAVARGNWLQRELLEEHGIPSGQLFLLDPVRDAAPTEDGQVTVQFSLDAR